MMRNKDVQNVMDDIEEDNDMDDDEDVHVNVEKYIWTVFSLSGFSSLYEVRSERTS